MKVECLKKQVDLNKIHWAIDKFKAEHGDNPSYIVINNETKAELIGNYYYDIMFKGSLKDCVKTDTIFGITVALSDSLKYGEVDIV